MFSKKIIIFLFLLFPTLIISQVENVPVSNPIYIFLQRFENFGYLKHKSLSVLPLQKKEITSCILQIKEHLEDLTESDKELLSKYEIEFDMKKASNTVLFYSETDSSQILLSNLFSNKEKYVYHYSDSTSILSLKGLALFDYYKSKDSDAFLLQGGFRVSGTIKNNFGYLLQVTNGHLMFGSKQLALQDNILLDQNVKFAQLNSDIDFTESMVRYDNDWFYAMIGRQTRYEGAGLNQKLYVSNLSPASDAISLGAKFSNFEYRFTTYSLLSLPVDTLNVIDSNYKNGSGSHYIPKFIITHRFAFKPEWGEIGLYDELVYSGRAWDVSYMNPLSFLKSLEHANHDRDNSIMGIDATIRLFSEFQIKGTWVLDDIIFDKIGKGFWSNKTTWNIAGFYSMKKSFFDLAIEYTRIEPYMFTHYNIQNTYTNDGKLFGSIFLPNSDALTLNLNIWYGERYPLSFSYSSIRHGANIYDATGTILIQNVGGEPLVLKEGTTKTPTVINFLDGNLQKYSVFQIKFGYELVRSFNLIFTYSLNTIQTPYIRLSLFYEYF